MGITIKDVAAVAKVSIATVSRVLMESDKVAPQTTEHVKKIVNQLGYRPDRLAQALRQKRSQTIGYIVPTLNNEIVLHLLAALECELAVYDLIILLTASSGKNRDEANQIERLLAHGVDGIFYVPGATENAKEELARARKEIPIVQLLGPVIEPSIDLLTVDYTAGIELMYRYAKKNKCRKVAFIGEGASTEIGEDKLKAFSDIAIENDDADSFPIRVGGHTIEFGRFATENLLSESAVPDAIICGNERIATGCLQALAQREGLTESVLVMGFQSTETEAPGKLQYTLARLPVEELAQEATRIMLQRFYGLDDPPLRERMSPVLRIQT